MRGRSLVCNNICFSSLNSLSPPPYKYTSSSLSLPLNTPFILKPKPKPKPKLKQQQNNNVIVAFSKASSSSSDNHNHNNIPHHHSPSMKTVLLNLIQEMEPMDVSVIQKDVPPTTLDAMKRTISGMLGLLPSDRFHVVIEALWEPLSKLLVSSMMTGYTLRNAEYRLSLEKIFDTYEGKTEAHITADPKLEGPKRSLNCERSNTLSEEDDMPSESSSDSISETFEAQDLGDITPEAQKYILELKSLLSAAEKELREVKRKSAALQMQQFVGEEKNDLLDYLRSLRPEKVAELSEPTCPEVKEAIYSVVHGLLATLSAKMHSKAPISENTSKGSVNVGAEGDCFDVVENASLQYQPLISLTRDYLARLLFWCMMLGHYIRGLEYRLELTELLSLPSNLEDYPFNGEEVT